MERNPFIKNKVILPVASLNKVEIYADGKYEYISDLLKNIDMNEANESEIVSFINVIKSLLDGLKSRKMIRRIGWEKEHWDYWKKIDKVIFGGGFTKSEVGKVAFKMLMEDKTMKVKIEVANNSNEIGIIGGAKYITQSSESGYIFDFGHTYIKRGFVKKEINNDIEILILKKVRAKFVNWKTENVKEALELNNYIFKVITDLINSINLDSKEINIFVSVANYMDNGRVYKRGGYGKLATLNPSYEEHLRNSIEEKYNTKVNIKMVHDIAAASYSLEIKEQDNVAIISLGTSIGIAFTELKNDYITEEKKYKINKYKKQ